MSGPAQGCNGDPLSDLLRSGATLLGGQLRLEQRGINWQTSAVRPQPASIGRPARSDTRDQIQRQPHSGKMSSARTSRATADATYHD